MRHAQRIAGQASALAGMISQGRPFGDVAQQILATRASLDSLLVRLAGLELDECLPNRAARIEVDLVLRAALGRAAHRPRVIA